MDTNDNNKRCTVRVEVPRKKPELKDVIIDAGIQGLKEAAQALARSLTHNDDNSPAFALTIDVPKIQAYSSSNIQTDTALKDIQQEKEDENCEENRDEIE